MKFLHTSDWHLGIDLHKHSLIEDQRYFIEQLCEIIRTEAVDVVLISGDIYDTTLASKEAIMLFDEAMRRICKELKRQVVVIAGNHDSQTRLSIMKDLLEDSGLHLFGCLEERIKPLTFGDVDVFPVPFVHKDRISAIYGQKFISYEQAFLCLMDDVRSQRTTQKQIVMAHAFVNGAGLSESDRFAMVGGSDLISKDVFHNLDYVALGHLHKPQTLMNHVVYSGSPLPYAFSEQADKHVVLWDSETQECSTQLIKPLHPMITLEGSYEDILQQLPQLQDHYTKIILNDVSISYELLGFLRERCPYLLALSGVQAQEVFEASTLDANSLDHLQDERIVAQFFKDYYQRDVSEEELNWLKEAQKGAFTCG